MACYGGGVLIVHAVKVLNLTLVAYMGLPILKQDGYETVMVISNRRDVSNRSYDTGADRL